MDQEETTPHKISWVSLQAEHLGGGTLLALQEAEFGHISFHPTFYRMDEAANSSLLISLKYVSSVKEAHSQMTGIEGQDLKNIILEMSQTEGREGCTDYLHQIPWRLGLSGHIPDYESLGRDLRLCI